MAKKKTEMLMRDLDVPSSAQLDAQLYVQLYVQLRDQLLACRLEPLEAK